MRTPELLLDFLAMARAASGASHASLLLHLEPPEQRSLLLLHGADAAAVPELADDDSAWAFIRRAELAHEMRAVHPPGTCARLSSGPDGLLIRLSLSEILARTEGQRRTDNERRRQPQVVTAPPLDGALWLGLRGGTALRELRGALTAPQSDTGAPGTAGSWLDDDFRLAARLAWSVYQLTSSLQDPISQLPGRMEFQAFLRRALAAAPPALPVGLLLINPDDFGMINHRYGRDFGDRAVREIADQLAPSVRRTDAVFRYSGAVFGVVLPGTNLGQCRLVAEKLRAALTRFSYLDDAVRLTFSMGGVVADAADLTRGVDPIDMLKRADMALNMAKLGGGARLLIGGMADGTQVVGRLDPLAGIFTADTEKDYRNMLLLWDTVGVVSAQPEPAAIAAAFVERLAISFRPDRAALYGLDASGALALLAADVRSDQGVDGRGRVTALDLAPASMEVMNQAIVSGRVERLLAEPCAEALPAADRSHARAAYAVPLMAREMAIGCLLLDGGQRQLGLDSSDLIFLNALATQVAVALDRATLAARWQAEKETERRQLKEELRELRQALQHTKLVYRSAAMHSVIDTLRRVATSDVTVLIVGESGTGKEMLAQTVHELSNRRDRPFITVDCGAIANTLLEAELFGHVRGAFTGAERGSEGRIAQSDGGTLFLDEIGELPVELQSKLLRFVQEKELTPVGSAQTRKVDVRIVAATNRRLDEEVAAGRFRADLYYRLQVIAVTAPPLRQRPDDVLPLAHYFLEKFIAQHGAAARRLSVAAEQRLLQHLWPGNVRELQHCMLRAVLMSDGETIDAPDIVMAADAVHAAAAAGTPVPGATARAAPSAGERAATAPTERWFEPVQVPTAATSDAADSWRTLHAELARQTAQALHQSNTHPVPLGRWLSEDLVLAASTACGDVSRRAARLIGVPESTLRRQLDKARTDRDAGRAPRAVHWQAMQPCIDSIIRDAADADEDLLERARLMLLDIVQANARLGAACGAALMGVTVPTFKRWREVHAA